MVQVQLAVPGSAAQHVLIVCLALGVAAVAPAQKFYPDDPLLAEPKPVSVGDLPERKTGNLYDFVRNSFGTQRAAVRPSGGTNTLGEAPDSSWFTNRHAKRRMTTAELKRGPCSENQPEAPYTVVGSKNQGINPGFRMKDRAGRLYWVKPDPWTNPEMASAADVIGSRFFYALGYFTSRNYLVHVERSDLQIGPAATVTGLNGKRRPMTNRDLDRILRKAARRGDGTWRMLASEKVDGTTIGPFRYEGTRSDDPNDTVPHETRRELRGLAVLCAWLNHTDAKGINSMDAIVEEKGVRSVRHYLIDFGSILGSDGDMAKNARYGNEFIIPTTGQALTRMLAFGLDVRPWERARHSGLRSTGRIESKAFDPEKWKPNYPNQAFLRRQIDDEYWAAKLVMAFRNEDIRAIMETGEYSDPRVTDYLVRVLQERRDKIGRTILGKVLPLDDFSVQDGRLRFRDLARAYDFEPAHEVDISWFQLDNQSGRTTPMDGKGVELPWSARIAADDSYFGVRLQEVRQPRLEVTVFLRKKADSFEVVGVERKS